MISETRDLYHRFGDLAFEDRRAIVDRVTNGREEIELTLAALPPVPKMTALSDRSPGIQASSRG